MSINMCIYVYGHVCRRIYTHVHRFQHMTWVLQLSMVALYVHMRAHAFMHARIYARTHARTLARTLACTLARTHAVTGTSGSLCLGLYSYGPRYEWEPVPRAWRSVTIALMLIVFSVGLCADMCADMCAGMCANMCVKHLCRCQNICVGVKTWAEGL